MKDMDFHPFANAWRLIKGAEFDELVADIQENGLRESIWLYEGKILDGRNRYQACVKANVEPKYRTYKGSDPISFVISLNKYRRHDSESDRAFAAARIADMRQGERTDIGNLASRDARLSQTKTATAMGVSRSSVQRAKKVLEKGSKALQQAAESGEVPLLRAASVVDLPKSEQLAAAIARPKKKTPTTQKSNPDSGAILADAWAPDDDEIASAELADKEYSDSIAKVMDADDKLAAAHSEIKRQSSEIAVLKLSRNGYMNGKNAITALLKTEQRKTDKLRKQLEKATSDNERLGERIAIMEAS